MSYDLKLAKICDNKIVCEDHIVESDRKTVILGKPVNSGIVVRINDFVRPKDFSNEILLKEDVSSQVTGLNKSFFVSQGPIYSGLKNGDLATKLDVIVRIKVTEEDESEQFTGVENYFFTQARPLMKSNDYDFNNLVDQNDIEIKINGQWINRIDEFVTPSLTYQLSAHPIVEFSEQVFIGDVLQSSSTYTLTIEGLLTFSELPTETVKVSYTYNNGIQNIDGRTGRIQLKQNLLITDVITITYFYQAKVQELVPIQSHITIKETPKVGQEVKIAYFSMQSDGWYTKTSNLTTIDKSIDVVFYRNRNVNRFFVEKENVSSQFTTTDDPPAIVSPGKTYQLSAYPIIKYSEYVYVDNVAFSHEKFTLNYANGLLTFSPSISGQVKVRYRHNVGKTFYTEHHPILPLYQIFSSTIQDTLNNAVSVFINGKKELISGIDSETGKIILYKIPEENDVVEISYWYESDFVPDRISVDYYVNSTYCDKCSSYYDLIDYTINKLGTYDKVFDENKLIQDLKKITRTILGSDPVATWYGTEFEKIIGMKSFPEITKTKILNQIVTALSKLKSAQIQQEEYQTVTDNEFLDYIESTNVQQSISDPSLYTADIKVVTQAASIVPVTETVQTRG